MMRLLCGFLLLVGALAAQIVVKDHATGAVLTTPLRLPDVAVNDSEQEALDVVNTGAAVITVQSAVATGLYYSLCCDTGFVLQPGQSHLLTLQFAPLRTGYFSGALQIDSLAIFLFTSSVPAPSVFVEAPGGLVQAHAGTPLVIALDASFNGQLPCVLRNDSNGPVTVQSLSASGDWVLTAAPLLPLTLAAGQQAAFHLSRRSGGPPVTSGILHVDQRSYAIDTHPPSPGIHLHLPGALLGSGQQAPISLTFDSPPAENTAGSVTVTLTTSGPIALSDPGILFPSTGAPSAAFSSVAGQTGASFSGQSSITLQTGTTAGTLHIHAAWEYSEDDLDVPLTASPVVIESVTATRGSNALDLSLTGYDNTRTAGKLSFSFFDSKGGFIGNTVTADDSEAFYNFFYQTASAAGGMFKLTAHFPVVGGTTGIKSVQVGIANTAGDAQSNITPFH